MKYNKTIPIVSVCATMLFLAIVILLHAIRPDKNIMSCFVSEYAVGDYSRLMTTAFLSLATGVSLVLLALTRNVKASKTSIITLGIFCVGAFLLAIFPTDIPGDPPTSTGLIHGLSALVALLNLGIAMISWGFVFRRNEEWKSMTKLSWFFGAVSLALFIIFFMSPPAFRGLMQRILLVWNISWILLINRKILSLW
ncbi:MAG TPA: DUF998 domain-containing protein [Panacibacter sp.]|nr:DUF998 domain-containing protein [Panacibacter sp.]